MDVATLPAGNWMSFVVRMVPHALLWVLKLTTAVMEPEKTTPNGGG